jgi:hypothetical protein
MSLAIQLAKWILGFHQPVVIGDPIKKKGGYDSINRLALEIQLTKRRLKSQ